MYLMHQVRFRVFRDESGYNLGHNFQRQALYPSPIPKHANQIPNPCQKQPGRNPNIPPRHGIPTLQVHKLRKPHDMTSHGHMSNIRDRARNQKVPHNLWFRRGVKHCDSNEAEETVNVAELEGKEVRGGRQRGGKGMRELRRREGGRVTSGGHIRDDSACWEIS